MRKSGRGGAPGAEGCGAAGPGNRGEGHRGERVHGTTHGTTMEQLMEQLMEQPMEQLTLYGRRARSDRIDLYLILF